tara:strand:+ start:255 stop:482 length:228 start_codon:yes stop_codon:yes gene_type:complete
MQKIRFHNSNTADKILDNKERYQTQNLDRKIVVDINKLLNRVKVEEKNETKRKIIFYSLVILGLSVFGTLIAILK